MCIDLYLRACAADLANVAVMELRWFWGPFWLLQLVLVKSGLLVGVHRWSRYHVAARVAPGRTGQLFEWRLDGGLLRLWLLRWRLRLCEVLLGRLVVVGGGGCRSVASWIITGVVNAWRWEHNENNEDAELKRMRRDKRTLQWLFSVKDILRKS